MLTYFNDAPQLESFLMDELGFSEEDAEDCYMDMEDYDEAPHKRSTRCSGCILDSKTGYYYSLYYTSDYDWGSSDFNLDTTALEMKEEIKQITVKKFVPIKVKE